MTKLTIVPDATGYKITPKDTFIAKEMTYGNMRRRNDFNEADFYVDVQWTIDLTTFSTLSSFFIANAGITFQIDLLILSSYIIEYDAKLVPNSFKIVSQHGDTIICGATLAVLPDQTEMDCHKEVVYIENCLNGPIEPVIKQLNFFFSDMNSNPAMKL